MHINLHAIWASVLLVYLFCKKWYGKLEPILLPLIKDVEQRAIDGKIGLDDRKAVLMKGLDIAQAQGLIKLNFLEKIIVSKIVDIIAEKLPDIQVSNNASSIINSAVNLVKK